MFITSHIRYVIWDILFIAINFAYGEYVWAYILIAELMFELVLATFFPEVTKGVNRFFQGFIGKTLIAIVFISVGIIYIGPLILPSIKLFLSSLK